MGDIVTYGMFIAALAAYTSVGVVFLILAKHGSNLEKTSLVLIALMNAAGNVLPAYLGLVTGQLSRFSFGFPLEVWALGFAIETGFLIMVAVGWLLPVKGLDWALHRISGTRYLKNDELFLWSIALVLGLGWAITRGEWSNWGYEMAGARLYMDPASSVLIARTPNALTWKLLKLTILVLAFSHGRRRLKSLHWVSIALAIGVIVDDLISGGRGNVLSDFIVIGVCLARHRGVKVVTGAAIAGAILVIMLTGPIREYRSALWSYDMLSFRGRVSAFQEAFQEERGGPWEYLLVAAERQDNVLDSGLLAIDAVYGSGFAGFTPYLGSLTAFVPRMVWPDKPIPQSRTSDYSGTPWYVAGRLRGMPWNSAGVGIGGISFWQFGPLGVVVVGLMSGTFLRLFARFAERSGLVGLFIFLVYARETYFLMVTNGDNMLRVLLQVIVPIVVAIGAAARIVVAVRRTYGGGLPGRLNMLGGEK